MAGAGQALPGQAGLWPAGSCFTLGALDPGTEPAASSALALGVRGGMGHIGSCHGSPGCQVGRPGRLSEPRDGKQTVCIELLRKAGLSWYSGRQKSLGLALCTLIIS